MIKKIAVLRANALGDYIFVLPALQALRETFPQAEIVLLGRAWHKEYLEDRPGPVDRVVVVPLYGGISEYEGYIPDENVLNAFFAEMHAEEFDIAFQLHGGGRNSNPFVLRLGAKLTVGLQTPDAAPLDINVPYIYYFNETLRYLEVVGRVGAKAKMIEPDIAVTHNDVREARRVLNNPGDKPIAVIHPGASDLRRRWPGENFAQLADYLVNEGFHVCITGLEWERQILDAIIDKIRHRENVQDLSGILSLGGTTGLLSFTGILISNDTGPLHVARALRVPTVGIYWFANIINASPITISVNRNLLSWTMQCPLCGLSTFKLNEVKSACKHDTSFVAEITVHDVIEAVHDVLETKKNFRTLQDVKQVSLKG